jgi:hypothetical protein
MIDRQNSRKHRGTETRLKLIQEEDMEGGVWGCAVDLPSGLVGDKHKCSGTTYNAAGGGAKTSTRGPMPEILLGTFGCLGKERFCYI